KSTLEGSRQCYRTDHSGGDDPTHQATEHNSTESTSKSRARVGWLCAIPDPTSQGPRASGDRTRPFRCYARPGCDDVRPASATRGGKSATASQRSPIEPRRSRIERAEGVT